MPARAAYRMDLSRAALRFARLGCRCGVSSRRAACSSGGCGRRLAGGGDPPGGQARGVWALPKGRIDEGETRRGRRRCARSAEETGAHGRSLGKLGDVRYWFHWEGERVFKVVSFFLVRYESGELGDVPEEFRARGRRGALAAARRGAALLAYKGEREMAERALARLAGEQDV